MKPDVSSLMPFTTNTSSGLMLSPGTPTTNTLTPTTLKCITQIFESDTCLSSVQNFEESGTLGTFEPPTVLPEPVVSVVKEEGPKVLVVPASTTISTISNCTKIFTALDSNSWQGGCTTVVTPSSEVPPPSTTSEAFTLNLPLSTINEDSLSSHSSERGEEESDDEWSPAQEGLRQSARKPTRSSGRSAAGIKRKMSPIRRAPAPKRANRQGGRKPAKGAKSEEDMDPEEHQKITVRRQRNKEAAARCRKRRMDLIDKLSGEVEGWESQKRALEEEIRTLRAQKDELEYILQTHATTCQIGQVAYTTSAPVIQAAPIPQTVYVAVKSEPTITHLTAAAPAKPQRPVSLSLPSTTNTSRSETPEGVQLETPSAGIALGFDAVTTGLTPSCPVMSSIITPTALVTPLLTTPTLSCSMQSRQNSSGSSEGPEYLAL